MRLIGWDRVRARQRASERSRARRTPKTAFVLTGGGVLKQDQLEEDREKLAEFYHDAGYIDFELRDIRYVYQTARKLVLHFVISEGTRYRVGAIDFKGVTLFPTNEISKRLKMNIGSIFTPWAVPIGAVPMFVTFTGWFWPKSPDPEGGR